MIHGRLQKQSCLLMKKYLSVDINQLQFGSMCVVPNLADKIRASHVHGLMKEKGKSIQDMLTDFIKDGGIVIVCGACSKASGLTKSDFIEGVTMGNPDLVMGL